MNNYADVYITPEQAADRLQLGVETIYRWLRSGKLRGSRISHKAWRISEQELASLMKQQNVSELLFEEYVAEHELGQPEHEPPFPGTTSRVDYRLPYKGENLWFEVKEFANDPKLVGSAGGGAYDPYVGIRAKIEAARKQFRDYEGECCSLVLFNERGNLVDICVPSIVLGAMLGNAGFSIPVNLETGEQVGPITNIFGDGGKLLNPYTKEPQNTTISAVIALERFALGDKEFRIRVEEKERNEKRLLSYPDRLDLLESDRASYERKILRAIVHENPHAAKPLPRDIFLGPFDERWGQSGNFIAPIFVGSELEKLRNLEHELELDMGPFWKHRNREARSKAGQSKRP